MQKHTLYLDSEDLNKLNKIGEKEDRSLSWMIRALVKYALKHWNKIKGDLK